MYLVIRFPRRDRDGANNTIVGFAFEASASTTAVIDGNPRLWAKLMGLARGVLVGYVIHVRL
jgi:hypothetical protein